VIASRRQIPQSQWALKTNTTPGVGPRIKTQGQSFDAFLSGFKKLDFFITTNTFMATAKHIAVGGYLHQLRVTAGAAPGYKIVYAFRAVTA